MEYSNTFIRVAADCPVETAQEPPEGRHNKKTIPRIQFEILRSRPYAYTQQDVLWLTHLVHKRIPGAEATDEARARYFEKGQPCLRTSALAKRYGWGFHFDSESKVALVPIDSEEYLRCRQSSALKQLTAMKNG